MADEPVLDTLMPPPPPPDGLTTSPRLAAAVEDAELLVDYSARTGITLALDAVKAVIAMRDTPRATSDIEAQFWIAFDTICNATKPATIEGLKWVSTTKPLH